MKEFERAYFDTKRLLETSIYDHGYVNNCVKTINSIDYFQLNEFHAARGNPPLLSDTFKKINEELTKLNESQFKRINEVWNIYKFDLNSLYQDYLYYNQGSVKGGFLNKAWLNSSKLTFWSILGSVIAGIVSLCVATIAAPIISAVFGIVAIGFAIAGAVRAAKKEKADIKWGIASEHLKVFDILVGLRLDLIRFCMSFSSKNNIKEIIEVINYNNVDTYAGIKVNYINRENSLSLLRELGNIFDIRYCILPYRESVNSEIIFRYGSAVYNHEVIAIINNIMANMGPYQRLEEVTHL